MCIRDSPITFIVLLSITPLVSKVLVPHRKTCPCHHNTYPITIFYSTQRELHLSFCFFVWNEWSLRNAPFYLSVPKLKNLCRWLVFCLYYLGFAYNYYISKWVKYLRVIFYHQHSIIHIFYATS